MPQKKHLGQVFLHDHNIIKKTVQKACINPNYPVVEIGCGKGILTKALAAVSKELYVIEIDPEWYHETQSKLAHLKHLNFINQSVLDQDVFNTIPKPFQIVANIPYHITSDILDKLVSLKKHIYQASIMVQKDVALKWVSRVNDTLYMSQSLYAQYHFDLNILFHVSKTCFYPVPKVDSSVIQLKPKQNVLNAKLEELVFKIIKSGFWGRRKPLRSCLSRSPYLQLSKQTLSNSQHQDILNQRIEQLCFDKIRMLANTLLTYS